MLVLRRLNKLTGSALKGFRKTLLLTVLDAFLASAPFGFLYYILLDMLSAAPNVQYQFGLVFACVVMMAIRALLARTIYMQINLIGFGAGRQIREQLGNHLRKLPMGFFQRSDFSNVNNSLLKDIDQIERIFTHLYAPMIATVAVLLFFAIGLTATDWRMGLAMLSTLPLAMLAYWLTRNYARKWQSYMQGLMHQLNDAVMEYVDGIKELKAHRMVGGMFARLDEVLHNTRNNALKAEVAAVYPVFSFNFLVELGFIILLVAVTWGWLGQTLTLAEVLLFLIAATRFFKPLLSMSIFMAELNFFGLAIGRLEKIMALPQLKNGNQTPIFDQLNVELKDVTFAYPGAKPLFEDFNLSIKHGAVTALVGPSGSGKSTLAALIARFWELDKGDIWVGGNKDSAPLSGQPLSQQHMVRLTDMDEEYWLKHVSVVFQSSYLFNDTVANNLRVAKADASDEALWQVLETAKLAERVRMMPDGLATELGAGGVHLSGGEQQRLAIARAILKDAPMVILDEATASLDPENEFDIQLAMQALVKGKTVLVIAHKLATVQYADHIVVLDSGKVVEQGKHQALLDNHSLYHELWHLQQQAQSWVLAAN